ncbi:hypothetical protein [Geodermatophilus sp. CPCC 206100]|uniref:hypothetical protein n=1 Tax=Geodermatophilus sp. CPCC 206100 TaxID=3020054 RepID=UPI003B000528
MGTVLAVLHVVTAVFLIGPMALLPHTALRAVRAGNAPVVGLLTRSTKVVTWAAAALERDPSAGSTVYGRLAAGSGVVSLLLVAVAVLMAGKP